MKQICTAIEEVQATSQPFPSSCNGTPSTRCSNSVQNLNAQLPCFKIVQANHSLRLQMQLAPHACSQAHSCSSWARFQTCPQQHQATAAKGRAFFPRRSCNWESRYSTTQSELNDQKCRKTLPRPNALHPVADHDVRAICLVFGRPSSWPSPLREF